MCFGRFLGLSLIKVRSIFRYKQAVKSRYVYKERFWEHWNWFFQFRDSAGARIPRRSSEIGRFEYLETFDGYGKKITFLSFDGYPPYLYYIYSTMAYTHDPWNASYAKKKKLKATTPCPSVQITMQNGL